MANPKPRILSKEEARAFVLRHLGLRRDLDGDMHALLEARRCIQLDPLDRIGNSPDLLAAARLSGTRRGDVHRALLPGGCFEHWFKVRCLLPPRFLPHYRARVTESGWFPYQKMCARPSDETLADVLAEFERRGPLRQRDLQERGMAVARYDHPWARKATMNMVSVDVLEARCALVVVGRTPQGKRYDLPSRVMPQADAASPDRSWPAFSICERTWAAGLLPLNAGPWWALANEARAQTRALLRGEGDPQDVAAVKAGAALVKIEGLERCYLAPPAALESPEVDDDGRMRVLSPLDPLIWDRDLVRHLWDFDYVWEVYKPPKQRRWGYYVCPLLHRGRLVGRFEAHREQVEGQSRIVVDNLWPAEGFEPDAFERCVARLQACQ